MKTVKREMKNVTGLQKLRKIQNSLANLFPSDGKLILM